MLFPKVIHEPHYRYIVEAQDTLPPEMEAEYAIKGITREERWHVVWSFKDVDAAYHQAAEDASRWKTLRKFRVRDMADSPNLITD